MKKMMISEIRNELNNLKDDNLKDFNSKICLDTKKEMMGIRIPELRTLAKSILKNTSLEEIFGEGKLIYQFNDNSYEEVLLEGFLISYAKMDLESKIPHIERYIPKIDSWSITDTFILKLKKSELENYWKFILKYVKSEKEFEIRFAIISMLKYYLIDEYIDKVMEILDKVNHEGYYVKMAVAWTLAEIGIKYNDKLFNYLEQKNNLDNFTYNKAIQKMLESYRISDEQKKILRTMKRR